MNLEQKKIKAKLLGRTIKWHHLQKGMGSIYIGQSKLPKLKIGDVILTDTGKCLQVIQSPSLYRDIHYDFREIKE